jgi:tRNA-dihydrouridine synthase A
MAAMKPAGPPPTTSTDTDAGRGEADDEPMDAVINPEGAAYRFSVAPMLDRTDRHFRLLFRQISRHSLLYTEMVVAQALHHARRQPGASDAGGRLERLIGFDPGERPLALQLGGDDPQLLAEAARLAADWGYDEINLNVGCPSEKVQKGRFGACLMADPPQVARCVEALALASGLPVTVKHRIGIDRRDSYAELLSFVDTLAAAGCQRFAVHARKAWLEGLDPKQNRTIPPLRYDLVHQLKAERPNLTIELNGGLLTIDDCRQQLRLVDGVMVGRAAYEHPLRWATVDARLHGDQGQTPARASTVVRGLIPHAERWRRRGNRLWPIARHLVHVVEGVGGARQWRATLTRQAGAREAGPEVLEAAARQLEERGL